MGLTQIQRLMLLKGIHVECVIVNVQAIILKCDITSTWTFALYVMNIFDQNTNPAGTVDSLFFLEQVCKIRI